MAINLNKIVLEKKGDVSRFKLNKESNAGLAPKEISINLNWEKKQNQTGSGLFSSFKKLLGNSDEIDLDLGCFYHLRNGEKMVIDGIQFSHDRGGDKNEVTNQGCYTESPWIWHSGDEKIGEGDGESILINPKGIPDIERIMVYCFIYEGAAKWNETNAVATIKVSNHPDIIVEMGQQSNSETFCALVEILIDTNQEITVKKLVSFHEGHEDCDSFYNWGMTWTEGDK